MKMNDVHQWHINTTVPSHLSYYHHNYGMVKKIQLPFEP